MSSGGGERDGTGSGIPAPSSGRGRGRRRLIAVTAVAAVVVLAAATAITWSALRTRSGPVEAVREYVDLIATGDVAEASRVVDPYDWTGYDGGEDGTGGGTVATSSPPTVDAGSAVTASDDLVLDAPVLTAIGAKASERITIVDVDLDYDADADVPVGGTVDVEVEYDLAGVTSRSTLRAERLDDTWFGFTRWHVVDPLLVPLTVQSNAPELGPAEVGADGDIAPSAGDDGTDVDPDVRYAVSVPAEVDLSGPDLEGASQRATLLYPGAYTLTATASTYLAAAPREVVVAEGTTSSSGAFGDVVDSSLWFEATPALYDRVSAEAPEFVAACFAAAADPPADCPRDLRLRSDFATDVVVTSDPQLEGITSYQVGHPEGVATEPAIRATFTTGRFDYTSDDGDRDDSIFFLYAWVHPVGDDVTIEFRPDL